MNSKLNKQPSQECDHFRRSFFWVANGEVDRNRDRTAKTLKGTRTMHTVKCIEPYKLLTRQLSCFCQSCQTGTGECANVAIVGPWSEKVLIPVPGPLQLTVQLPAQESDDQLPDQKIDDQLPAQEIDDQLSVQEIHDQLPAPAIGEFVEAVVEGKYRTMTFFAKVLDVDEANGDLKLHYLTLKPGSTDVFVWADKSWLSKGQITKIVPPPVLVPARGIAFTFQ